MTEQRCASLTKSGQPCRNNGTGRSKYCRIHKNKPIRAPKADRRSRRAGGGRALAAPPTAAPSSHALYYPTISFPDDGWLKTAALFWDTVATITPERERGRRESDTASIFRAAGIVDSAVIEEYPECVEAASHRAMTYLDTDAGHIALMQGRTAPPTYMHARKLSMNMRHYLEDLRHGLARAPFARRDDWISIDSSLAGYYMTLLAAEVAARTGRAPTSNAPHYGTLAAHSASGVAPAMPERYDMRAGHLAPGLLASLVLRTVAVDASTPPIEIINFREKHHVVLGQFRAAIRDMAAVPDGLELEALQRRVQTIYQDEALPAMEELRAKLREHRVTAGFSNMRTSLLASASPTVLGSILAASGAGPAAIAAGVGLSLVAQAVNYVVGHRELSRASPWTYVLVAEGTFGRRRRLD